MDLSGVSAILPTLNCRPLIEPVAEDLGRTLRHVGEVIVVDSDSNDGTPELLREVLDFPHVRFLRHPPGLYASWNLGIREARGRSIHISTAGDAIDLAGLVHLQATLDSTGADVAVAAPEFFDQEGTSIAAPPWPIFELLERRPEEETVILGGPELAAFALAHCRPPGRFRAWLGSSSSNLYRAEILKEHPFPEHVGTVGDVLWGLEQASLLTAAFCRRRVGRFVMHAGHRLTTRRSRRECWRDFNGPWLSVMAQLIADAFTDGSSSERRALFELVVGGYAKTELIISEMRDNSKGPRDVANLRHDGTQGAQRASRTPAT